MASQDCAGAGQEGAAACDVDRFISVDAALCIARARGLGEGLKGLSGSIVYNHRHGRVIYTVKNTLKDDPGDAGGEHLAIDAITGEVLDRGGWAAVA
jgi:hypothetical protein